MVINGWVYLIITDRIDYQSRGLHHFTVLTTKTTKTPLLPEMVSLPPSQSLTALLCKRSVLTTFRTSFVRKGLLQQGTPWTRKPLSPIDQATLIDNGHFCQFSLYESATKQCFSWFYRSKTVNSRVFRVEKVFGPKQFNQEMIENKREKWCFLDPFLTTFSSKNHEFIRKPRSPLWRPKTGIC